MSYEEDKARALARVRKMLALANDAAATEGERENALRMAHATLAKYNLELAEAVERGDAREADADRIRTSFELAEFPWKRRVCASIGRLLFCEVYRVRSRKNYCHMYYVGRGANARAAIELSMHVIASCLAEARRMSADHAHGISRSTWELDFCKGAAERIAKRCEELRKFGQPLELPKTPGTALVLATHYERERDANLALLKRDGIMLRTRHTSSRGIRSDGHEHGRAYGDRVRLQQQIR